MELVTMFAALLSLVVGCAALLVALRAARMASDNLAQGAYAQAVKGLLDLKHRAAGQLETFQPAWKSALPQAFARSNASIASLSLATAGIWQLSSVLSLIQRGKNAGLTEHQSEGLKPASMKSIVSTFLCWKRIIQSCWRFYANASTPRHSSTPLPSSAKSRS